MDLMKPVSGRQFAKMVGQVESAVRKAFSRQSILKGRTPEGKYIPLIAAEEWGKEILPEFLKESSGPQKKTPVKKRQPAVKKTRVHKLKPLPQNADEVAQEMMNEPLPKVTREEVESDPDAPLSNSAPKTEAERKAAIIKTRILEINLQEKKGELIPRSKMKVIYEYGAQLRSDFEGISARVIDDILANAEDRNKAKRLLDEEIYRTLNGLSDPEKINL